MEFLLTEASADAGNPPADYRPDIGMENLRTEFHIQQSDIRPLVMEQLSKLKSDLERNLSSASDRYTRTHFEYVLKQIEEMI
jgi:hypothetical protein